MNIVLSGKQNDYPLEIFVLIFHIHQYNVCKLKKREYFCSPDYCPYL